MPLIANESIEIVAMPERPTTTESFICSVGGKRLPATDDGTKTMSIGCLDNDMDMVWHDAPCEQPISFAIKVHDRILDQPSNKRLLEPTRAQTAIQPMVRFGQVIGKFSKRFGNSSR